MRRTRTTDAGSRYLVTLPFARELSAEEREGVETALSSATFDRRHEFGTDPIDTRDVDVSAEAARVTVALSSDGDLGPADVLGRLSRAVGEWHGRDGPVGEPTRAGGEQSIATLDAATLDVDRDPEGSAASNAYLLAYPERRLDGDEVELLEHVTGDDAVVTPTFLALLDGVSPVRERPAYHALRQLREDLRGHVDDGHPLRSSGFFSTREVGTLSAVDDVAREALVARGEQQTPHTPESDAADDEVSA